MGKVILDVMPGDVVWFEYNGKIVKDVVSNVSLTTHGTYIHTTTTRLTFNLCKVGESIFKSREEAEKILEA